MADLSSTKIYGRLTVIHDAILKANAYITGNTDINGNVIVGGDVNAVNAILSGDVSAVNGTLTGNLGVVDINASGILSGNGSGLTNVDAETLDSLDSTAFVRSDVDDEVLGKITFRDSPNVDTNTNTTPFQISRSGSTTNEVLNIGVEDRSVVFDYIEDSTEPAPGSFIFQVSKVGNSITNDFQITATPGVATINGDTIWTDGNQGTGSGLDADTVDGLEASQFLRSDVDTVSQGQLTVKSPTAYITDNLTTLTDAPISVPQTTVSTTDSFVPFIHQKTRNDFGFVSHMSLGTYKESTAEWGEGTTGFYVAIGGNDNYPTENYTMTLGGDIIHSSGNVFWHTGNDGSGSGLDADTVDGIEGSQIVRNDQANTITGNQTIEGDLTVNGGGNSVKFKSGGSDLAYASFYARDIDPLTRSGYIGYGSAGTNNLTLSNEIGEVYLISTGQAYINTNQIWHAGNDGAGSTLDADTVDGIQAASFIRSDQADVMDTGTTTSWPNAIDSDPDAWSANYVLKYVAGNNGLAIISDSTTNQRRWGLQAGHSSSQFASTTSDAELELNPFGGDVTINSNTAWHAGNDGPGSTLDADTLDGKQLTTIEQDAESAALALAIALG